MMNRVALLAASCVALALVGCGVPPDIKANSLSIDVQPDFSKLTIQFAIDRADPSDPAHPMGELNYGDTFLWTGDLFEAGTSNKIGAWICKGTKHARIQVVGLDQPYTITNSIEKTFGSAFVTYAIEGKGEIDVIGLEPGFDGHGGLQQAVVGGTGDFAYASGIAKKQMALPASSTAYGQSGGALDPTWKATQTVATFPAITPASHRVTFEFNTPISMK
jgi:hypothetical protein